MTTIHRYILWQMLKSLAIALPAMTALVTLAGGVFSIIRYPGVGPAEVSVLLPLLTPLVLTFTLPLATLLSATLIYGRMAADNEFTACSAAGMNVHRLFRAAVLVSVVVALVTTVFINYVLPGLYGQIRTYVSTNFRGIAEKSLNTKGHVALRRDAVQFYLTGANVQTEFARDALQRNNWDPNLGYLKVDEPLFIHLSGEGELQQLISAEMGWVVFDTQREPMQIEALVTDAVVLAPPDRRARQASQVIGPYAFELPLPPNISFFDLTRLLEIYRAPWTFTPVADAIQQLVDRRVVEAVADGVEDRLDAGVPLRASDGATLELNYTAVERTGAVTWRLNEVRLSTARDDPLRPTQWTAPAGVLEGFIDQTAAPGSDRFLFRLALERDAETPVVASNPGSAAFEGSREQQRALFEPLRSAALTASALTDVSPEAVLQDAVAAGDSEQQAALVALVDDVRREAASLVHFRFGFAASVLVTAPLAAALGMLFRGGRTLTAFALASIPVFLTVTLLVAGRQTAEKAGTELLGAGIIWGGLLFLLATTVTFVRVGIRR